MAERRQALLAIDQGTTSSRAVVFTPDYEVVASAQREFQQIYPQPGWVEHDPEVIWATVRTTAREAIAAARKAGYEPVALGITNQRETTLVWDRATGEPLHNAIVWQDRRTADVCARLREAGHADRIQRIAGLVLDPYFSAAKISWILDHVEGARARAEAGELAFGTVDSWLIWRLTGGALHVTDATNASRTSLFDIVRHRWDPGLMELFGVPAALLPEVRDSAGDFGTARAAELGLDLPITGVAAETKFVHRCPWGEDCVRSGGHGRGCWWKVRGYACHAVKHAVKRGARSIGGFRFLFVGSGRGRGSIRYLPWPGSGGAGCWVSYVPCAVHRAPCVFEWGWWGERRDNVNDVAHRNSRMLS